jgi:hypothetical protein
MNFQRGLDPKEAMGIGQVAICKKAWDKILCEKCTWADFGWRPEKSITTKNYCKLNYWGIPDKQ